MAPGLAWRTTPRRPGRLREDSERIPRRFREDSEKIRRRFRQGSEKTRITTRVGEEDSHRRRFQDSKPVRLSNAKNLCEHPLLCQGEAIISPSRTLPVQGGVLLAGQRYQAWFVDFLEIAIKLRVGSCTRGQRSGCADGGADVIVHRAPRGSSRFVAFTCIFC